MDFIRSSSADTSQLGETNKTVMVRNYNISDNIHAFWRMYTSSVGCECITNGL